MMLLHRCHPGVVAKGLLERSGTYHVGEEQRDQSTLACRLARTRTGV
jgi:hypothetical protein